MKNVHFHSGAVLMLCSMILALIIGCGQTGPVAQDETAEGVRDAVVPDSYRNETSAATAIEVADELVAWNRVEEMLERVPGVRLLRTPGQGMRVIIRGFSSLHASNEPLYVVDGLPMYVDPGEGLYWLDPRDVKRIEVLKDVGSTAIYGMRGANGVIVITTKH